MYVCKRMQNSNLKMLVNACKYRFGAWPAYVNVCKRMYTYVYVCKRMQNLKICKTYVKICKRM